MILRQNCKDVVLKKYLGKSKSATKNKILHLEYSQKKFNLIFHGKRETDATCEEEINNLCDTMFGDDDIHMLIRQNHVSVYIAYQ